QVVADSPEELHFLGLFQILLRLTNTAERFYAAHGYRGNLLIRSSVHGVQGQVMRFITPAGPYFLEAESAEDYRCFTDDVTAERLVGVDQFRLRRVEVLTDILSE